LLCFLDTILQSTVGAVTENIALFSQAINVQLNAIQGQMNSNIAQVNGQLANIGMSIQTLIITRPWCYQCNKYDQCNIHWKSSRTYHQHAASSKYWLYRNPSRYSRVFLSPDVIQSIRSLQIPTLDQVEAEVSKVVSIPFDLVENSIRDKFTSISQSINITLAAPLTSSAPPLTFCQDKFDVSWIDETVGACVTAIYISIAVILFVAVLLTIGNAIWIRRMHLRGESRVEDLEEMMNPSLIDRAGKRELARDLVAQAASPVFYSVTRKSGERMFKKQAKQTKWKW
jgi:hypothetical protein